MAMGIDMFLYGLLWYFFSERSIWIKTIMVVYLLYCLLDNTPRKGGYSRWSNEQMERFRHNWFIHRFSEYFPIQLVKTADLPVTDTYIFLYHPHGVISVGACGALISNGCNFDILFPGIRRKGVTLNSCFLVPICRDWMLLLGIVSANKQTLVHLLQKKRESIVLVPGGAIEALSAQPGNFVCHLNKRKGFVKLALETNSKLVPCLGFGENAIFPTVVFDKKSWQARLQQYLIRWLTFSIPIIASPLPQAHPIHVVVGKPVEFAQSAIEKQDVDECHAQYLRALQDLYNEHKAKYGHEHIPIEIH